MQKPSQTGDRTTLRAGGKDAPARSRLERAGAVALWLVAWQAASVIVGNPILLAGPAQTLLRLGELMGEARFLSVVGFSLVRIVGGFLAAYASAVVLAFVAHRWPVVARLLAPGVAALKSVPIACVIVLLLIWVGSREVSGIAVFVAIFPAVYFACLEGLGHVDGQVTEMLELLGARRLVVLGAHVWPSVLPHLLGTARNVCGMAFKAGIAAELIGSPTGSVGERIYQAKILLETGDLFAWTCVVVALAAVCERIFVALLSRSDALSRQLALLVTRGSGVGQRSSVPASIVMSDAAIGYGEKCVAGGVSLNLGPGSCTVLDDASGTGKTTLLRTVARLQPLLAGEAPLLPPTVSMVFQEARLVEQLSAVQNVQLVAGMVSERQIREALAELLEAGLHDVPVSQLSGGQRRRVEIVRALLCPSTAVLLDEPFASLDDAAHRRSAEFVRVRLAGRTLLAASHAAGDAELLGADRLHLFG